MEVGRRSIGWGLIESPRAGVFAAGPSFSLPLSVEEGCLRLVSEHINICT